MSRVSLITIGYIQRSWTVWHISFKAIVGNLRLDTLAHRKMYFGLIDKRHLDLLSENYHFRKLGVILLKMTHTFLTKLLKKFANVIALKETVAIDQVIKKNDITRYS